jgi:hypothetical protein
LASLESLRFYKSTKHDGKGRYRVLKIAFNDPKNYQNGEQKLNYKTVGV